MYISIYKFTDLAEISHKTKCNWQTYEPLSSVSTSMDEAEISWFDVIRTIFTLKTPFHISENNMHIRTKKTFGSEYKEVKYIIDEFSVEKKKQEKERKKWQLK